MRFEKIWAEQCGATKRIKRRFGAKSALDYLIGEKLITFADAAEAHPEFARELPRFLAAVWRIFNEYEIAGYVASLKPKQRKRLRSLLYLQHRLLEESIQHGRDDQRELHLSPVRLWDGLKSATLSTCCGASASKYSRNDA